MTLLGIISIIVSVSFSMWFNEQQESYQTEKEMEAIMREPMKSSRPMVNEQTMEEPATRELVIQVLQRMGCQYEDKENDSIYFEYQGVEFIVETANDCLFINLIWPWCYSFSIFDIDEFARVRKVINEINDRGTCTLYYIQYPESDEIAVHIRKNLIFVPQIPQIEEYLQATLRGFFKVARALGVEMEIVKMQECVEPLIDRFNLELVDEERVF
jgi:hypothetical protein